MCVELTNNRAYLCDFIHLETVEENMIGFTDDKIKKAKEAKKLYHKLGAPGMGNFKYIVKGNMIKNCPIEAGDIERMTKIWGKDIAVLKGKTIQRTPRKVIEENFEVPDEP